MALRDNSIGGFQFIALLGELVPPRQRIAIDDRPGVTGQEYTLLARKGEPFTLISQVDSEDIDDAEETYRLYLDLIEDQPVEVIKSGRSTITAGNYKCKVLSVLPLKFRTIRGAVGNLKSLSPHEGFCECQWTLQAVPTA